MKIIKIMPCLDMKEGRVVKGVHFVNIRDAGDPVENADRPPQRIGWNILHWKLRYVPHGEANSIL